VELIMAMAIIVFLAALAAAFAPSVLDSQNLTRAVDQFEQWLLSAKMRAKRDGLATGIRFVQNPGDPPGAYSQFQYIQQPDPLSGGWRAGAPAPGSVPHGSIFLAGGVLQSASAGVVTFANVDFTLNGLPLAQWLVQPGDSLEVRDGGVYLIGTATGPATLQLAGSPFDTALTVTPTTNYRILRQPRVLIGEPPLQMPGNLAVDMNPIPPTAVRGTVQAGASGNLEILFAPSGAVVGTNAGSSKVLVYIHDMTQVPADPSRAGIVAIQTSTGFIGAYSVAPGPDPFLFAEEGRSSGL
jgi:hypothetical protein